MQNGDVIIATAEILPIINHYGVIGIKDGKTYVFHNTNEKNVAIDPLEKFLEKRQLKSVKKSIISGKTFKEVTSNVSNCLGRFNYITRNCWNFKQCVTNQKPNKMIQKLDKTRILEQSIAVFVGVIIAILLAQKLS